MPSENLSMFRALRKLAPQLEACEALEACERSGLVVSIHDEQGEIVHFSRAVRDALGLAPDAPTARADLVVYDEDRRRLDDGELPFERARVTGFATPSSTLCFRGRHGGEVWLRMSYTPLVLANGCYVVLGVGSDVTELKSAEAALTRAAETDPLTELLNRAGLRDVAALRIEMPSALPVSVIVIDVDRFKRVNDQWGHDVGDEALRHIACQLRDEVRAGDYVGRWGGDEFVVVMPRTRTAAALAVAERIRATVSASPLTLPDAAVGLTVTAGVATSRMREGFSVKELLTRADRALYEAKGRGRDQVGVAA